MPGLPRAMWMHGGCRAAPRFWEAVIMLPGHPHQRANGSITPPCPLMRLMVEVEG